MWKVTTWYSTDCTVLLLAEGTPCLCDVLYCMYSTYDVCTLRGWHRYKYSTVQYGTPADRNFLVQQPFHCGETVHTVWSTEYCTVHTVHVLYIGTGTVCTPYYTFPRQRMALVGCGRVVPWLVGT